MMVLTKTALEELGSVWELPRVLDTTVVDVFVVVSLIVLANRRVAALASPPTGSGLQAHAGHRVCNVYCFRSWGRVPGEWWARSLGTSWAGITCSSASGDALLAGQDLCTLLSCQDQPRGSGGEIRIVIEVLGITLTVLVTMGNNAYVKTRSMSNS